MPPTVSESMRIVGWPTPTGTDWPSLPHVPKTRVELQVVADHRHARQHLGTVADQHRALHGHGLLAVLDEVGLARGEHELAARDVDLAAAEVRRVDAFVDRRDDLFGIVLAGQHVRVRHARHRRVRERLAPAVARRFHVHEARVHLVEHVALRARRARSACCSASACLRRRRSASRGGRRACRRRRPCIARSPRARRFGPRTPTCLCG